MLLIAAISKNVCPLLVCRVLAKGEPLASRKITPGRVFALMGKYIFIIIIPIGIPNIPINEPFKVVEAL